MSISFSPYIQSAHFPPISEVNHWLASRLDNGLKLIDLCQAVPDYPPAPDLTDYLATLLDDPKTSRYSPDEGLPEVLESVCNYYQRHYDAQISHANICLTIGASQAFWLAIITLCQAGDEVIIQAPYYFDHAMALDMLGIRGVYAPFDERSAGLPSPNVIESLITGRTRAILLVTPSNPTGVIIPPEILAELYVLAHHHNIALILDETYNGFIPGEVRPHGLFTKPDWGNHFVHITSFGKTFALTGYRAGLLAASKRFIYQALKIQDTMAVCQPRITQHAVKFGLDNLDSWVARNCIMMTRRHDLFRSEFMKPGNSFQLVTSGAFFGWVRHPFNKLTSRQTAKLLVEEAAILSLPGEVFGPSLAGYLRLAFGNIREEAIYEAIRRFRELNP